MLTDVRSPCLKWLGVLLVLGACVSAQAKDREKVVIKHYDRDFSRNIREYLTAVLHLTLEKSRREFGDYEIEFYSKSLSPTRSKLETERGEHINTLFAPDWLGPFLHENRIIRVPFPVFKELLGFRNLIVDKTRAPSFKNIKTAATLRTIRAGQGANWGDVDILKGNGLKVVEAQSYESLFPMLVKDRYDYLPLSILEAAEAMNAVPGHVDHLTVIDDINLFYPVPFSLYVHAREPELARRFRRGLEIALADGSLDEVFTKFFPGVEAQLRSGKKKVMLLANPLIDAQTNALITGKFMADHGAELEVLE